MKILAIETSCDETAVSILEAEGGFENPTFHILGNVLYSQAHLHQEFGGVYPNLAKREHAKNLVPILEKALAEAGMHFADERPFSEAQRVTLCELFTHEPELLKQFSAQIPKLAIPDIDAIAVTYGPGLEPALWVGINFANALGLTWQKPVIPINHMEGHVVASLLHAEERGPNADQRRQKPTTYNLQPITFPLLALLISGGHTELVLMKDWFSYKIIGETLDDAVGEAFDKVARMLGLPYPGGPQISLLAERARKNAGLTQTNAEKNIEHSVFNIRLPRPMIHTDTCDFSFAGLKTAVLYTLKKIPDITDEVREHVALEFENAATEVLVAKTKKALGKTGAQTLVLGGGVSANTHIRRSFVALIAEEFQNVELRIPDQKLTTDNAVMIAVAAYFRSLQSSGTHPPLRAKGTLRLAS